MSRKAISAILLFMCGLGMLNAQNFDPWVNDDLDRALWKENFSNKSMEFHGAVRPYTLSQEAQADSTVYGLNLSSKISIAPVIGLEGAYSQGVTADTDLSQGLAAIGLRMQYRPSPKLTLNTDLIGAGAFIENASFPEGDAVINGLGRGTADGESIVLFQPLFDLDFRPSDIFSIGVGKGKHFFGHGYRSLILSDNASPYPYLRFQVKVWHLQYMSLFSSQQGVSDIFAPIPDFQGKFTATHLLSWNITPNIDLQIFESIVWQAKDSLSDRGFDVNYLNPIIFYRPVEFSQGSADNALIGFGMSFKVYPRYHLYFQIGLDEFLLDQLRARNGWWGNKFGVQVGGKAFDVFGVDGLYVQGELNLARPFTYSHGSPLQSYTHFNEPLAHPLGANFYEATAIGVYSWGKFEIREQLTYAQYGRDGDQGNLGGNVLRSYVNPDKITGNFIGQGEQFESLSNAIWLSYVLEQSSDFRLQIGHRFQKDFGPALNANRHFLTLGARMNFRDGYR